MEQIKSKKIAIFGHYGNKNYGDESIIAAVLGNLKTIIPEAAFYCFSVHPEDSVRTHSVDSFPIRRINVNPAKQNNNHPDMTPDAAGQTADRKSVKDSVKDLVKRVPFLIRIVRILQQLNKGLSEIPAEVDFLKKSYQIIKDFDLLLVTGSNQFLDNFGGTWGFPYTLLKWTVLCKWAGVKLAYASVGAGPLDNWFSKFFVHLAVVRSDYLSYRDVKSKKLVEKTIFPINGLVFPDLAHSLEFRSTNQVAEPRVIGINPMPVFDNRYWYVHDEEKYHSYIKRMAELTVKLTELHHPVFFFNTMIRDIDVAIDILDCLPKKIKSKINIKEAQSVNQLMQNIDTADIVVSTRFHGAVLAYLAEKPILGICYYRKTRDIMEEMGQARYAVDIETFTIDQMLQHLEELKLNYSNEKLKIRAKNSEYRNMLHEQYQTLRKLILRN